MKNFLFRTYRFLLKTLFLGDLGARASTQILISTELGRRNMVDALLTSTPGIDLALTQILNESRSTRLKALKILFGEYSISDKDFGLNNALNRDRWVQTQLAGLAPQGKILDVGAGEQPYAKYCSHLKYFSQDFPVFNSDIDSKGLRTDWSYPKTDFECDVHLLPIEDESFDVVLCTEVLEHVHSPSVALAEMCRVLKKGGLIVLTAPFCSLTHFSPHFYCTGFSENFFNKFLTDFGMTNIEIEYNGGYFQFLAQELYRVRDRFAVDAGRGLQETDLATFDQSINILQKYEVLTGVKSDLLSFGLHVTAKKK